MPTVRRLRVEYHLLMDYSYYINNAQRRENIMAAIPGATVTISADEWEASNYDRHNNIDAAEWALDICK